MQSLKGILTAQHSLKRSRVYAYSAVGQRGEGGRGVSWLLTGLRVLLESKVSAGEVLDVHGYMKLILETDHHMKIQSHPRASHRSCTEWRWSGGGAVRYVVTCSLAMRGGSCPACLYTVKPT